MPISSRLGRPSWQSMLSYRVDRALLSLLCLGTWCYMLCRSPVVESGSHSVFIFGGTSRKIRGWPAGRSASPSSSSLKADCVSDLMLPVGPFCPFVSKSFRNLEGVSEGQRAQMEAVLSRVDQLAYEQIPDLQEHLKLSIQMREADSKWRADLMRMRHAEDFQTRELYEFTEAHLGHLGVQVAEVESLAAWQANVLESFGSKRTPPAAPVDSSSPKMSTLRSVLDSVRMGGQHESLNLVLDFSPPASMDTSLVNEELQTLERDHEALIQMGQTYGAFDSEGKKLFLDQLDRIAERWKIYLSRFRLMGESHPAYVSGAYDLLQRLGLSAGLAQKLVSSAHQQMRRDAEAS
eukprot:TRINITY_DN58697_c0_g1_i1.p1 TRINITY_DN58697_c0_g1~~TRINITY_DN58697_c0_g1_i1.p1  ORF type:complete len:349 (-),score=37.00 TRINITY_DN58697_c0_g1_i1:420-1466(-)